MIDNYAPWPIVQGGCLAGFRPGEFSVINFKGITQMAVDSQSIMAR
jgi:hypothetical protein